MIKALLIVLSVFALLSCYLWNRVDYLVATNDRLNDDVAQYELAAQSNTDTIAALEESVTQRDKLLTKQYKTNQTLHGQLQQKQRELIQLSKTDETVKDWAVEPVPDAISQLLNPTKDSNQN